MANEIFISYSRRDKDAFVKLLVDTLKAYDYDPWVDWDDIPPNAKWREEIKEGIYIEIKPAVS